MFWSNSTAQAKYESNEMDSKMSILLQLTESSPFLIEEMNSAYYHTPLTGLHSNVQTLPTHNK